MDVRNQSPVLHGALALADYEPDALYAFTGHAKRLKEARTKLEAAVAAHFNNVAQELKVRGFETDVILSSTVELRRVTRLLARAMPSGHHGVI